ncbi:protease inhibitor I42 family protein [Mycobacterium stomatepiae]|nr:protease inhibitor I42 family protein [Mycobacterium stomatepiae]MCV7163906.1 protease inhibitor I42 family protein [Mycobacterium stomatepiae]
MRWKVALSSAVLLLVAGCSETNVTAHDSDNGRHVTIEKGDVFDIVLADNYPTSHCQWHEEGTPDTAILNYLGSRYQWDTTAPAAPGTFTSRYKATGAGAVHVTLVQEDNAHHVARRFALDVTVLKRLIDLGAA